jgi:acyl-CoA thioesterase
MSLDETPAPVTFPLQEFLGFVIERADRQATVRLTVDERHLNPNGVAHGSVAFAIMDTAMGAAAMSVVPEGQMCATIEMHTRFHRPACRGELRAEATVVSPGKRVVHLEARTYDGADALVASATASFAIIGTPATPSATTA